MSFGKLASAILVPDVLTAVYTAPSDAVVGIIITNTNNVPAAFGISIGPNATPQLQDYIEVNSVLGPSINPTTSKYRLEKVPMTAGEIINIMVDTPGVVVRIHGADGIDLTTAKYSY